MLTSLLLKNPDISDSLIRPFSKQVSAWRKADRKMRWHIPKEEFETISKPPDLTGEDIREGFEGVILSYGFGDDGNGNADAVLSGKLAWDYAGKKRGRAGTWQCEYVDFNQADHFRLRPDAPPRPRGFRITSYNVCYTKLLRAGENGLPD